MDRLAHALGYFACESCGYLFEGLGTKGQHPIVRNKYYPILIHCLVDNRLYNTRHDSDYEPECLPDKYHYAGVAPNE